MKERLYSRIVLFFEIALIIFSFYVLSIGSALAADKNKIQIASFESNENWQAPGVLDNKNKSGATFLLLSSTGFNWQASSSLSKEIDLSSFEKNNYSMVINVYLEDPNSISGIRLDLGKDSGNFYYTSKQTPGFYQNGWNKVVLKQNEFIQQGDVGGWGAIKWLRVNLAAKDDNSKVSIYLDDWYLGPNEAQAPILSQNDIKSTSVASAPRAVQGINDINNNINNNQGGIMNYIYYVVGIILVALIVAGLFILRRRKKAPPEQVAYKEEKQPKTDILKKNVNLTVALVSIGITLGVMAIIGYFTVGSNTVKTAKPVVLGTSITSANPSTTNKLWEYKVVIFSVPSDSEKTIEESLNTLGNQGWELVSQSSVSTGKTGSYYQYNTLKKAKN